MSNDIWADYRDSILSKIQSLDIYANIENKQTGSGDWITGLCPFHTDTSNSFAFNQKDLQFCCFAGCGKGSVFDFMMLTSGMTFKNTLIYYGDKLNIPRPKEKSKKPPIDKSIVKTWHANLQSNSEIKRYLNEKRGLSNKTLDRYEIGWDPKRERNTIPIKNDKEAIVNVRFYNAKKKPKIINYVEGTFRYGSPARLYGIDELAKTKEQQIIICEGEWDRLLLQQEGFMAVTGTCGCSSFRPEWIPYFKDKDVVLLYDCDTEGQKASKGLVLKAFEGSGMRSIKNVLLPLKGDKDDKDITDFFMRHGHTRDDLIEIINNTPVHEYKKQILEEKIIPLDSFVDIEKPKYINKKVQCELTVCGETSESFHCVEEFRVTFCNKLRKGECCNCKDTIVVPHNAQEYIGSCMSTNVQLIMALRTYCCDLGQKPSLEILKQTTIKEFFCHQRVNRIVHKKDEDGNIEQIIDSKKQELIEKKVYYLSSDHVRPGHYLATGYVKTHPKTQQITFLIEDMIPQEDDYQSFSLSDNIDNLKKLQAISWEEMLTDLRDNVTRVYNRDEILISLLLTYCSPLWIPFNGDLIRGWLVSMIIGDPGTGKTQTYTKLSEFLNIGDVFSGLTGSRTGLSYAMVEHRQKGWQVRIGRYPANSRKLLIIDEAHFVTPEDMRTLSIAMEQGFMQIDRVKSKGYESMTRLVMICNPKKDKVMDNYIFGCEALSDLYPATILRRIDLALFSNSSDFSDLGFINQHREKIKDHKITSEMLRALVYWVWNLKPDQIVFEDGAEWEILSQASILSETFGYANDIPLILPSDCRNTLARITTCFATLRVSASDDFTKLIVKMEHVRLAVKYLSVVYSHDNCSLDEYSDIQKANNFLLDYDVIEKAFLDKKENEKFDHVNENMFSKTINVLRMSAIIRRDDLSEQVGCNIDALRNTIKLLKKFNLLDSSRFGYKKKPKFNKFLRRFLKEYPDFFKSGFLTGNL